MQYLKHLLYQCLVVFFVDYLVPGVDVTSQTKIPYLGGDLIFALGLGLLLSLLPFLLKAAGHGLASTIIRLLFASLVIAFASYALLKILPLGIATTSLEGYIFGALAVSIVGTLLNAMYVKRMPPCEPPPMV